MQHLALSPLPCIDYEKNPRGMPSAQPGYVDDDVVMTLLIGVAGSHPPREAEWFPMAPDQMDYAGWIPIPRFDIRFSRPDPSLR